MHTCTKANENKSQRQPLDADTENNKYGKTKCTQTPQKRATMSPSIALNHSTAQTDRSKTYCHPVSVCESKSVFDLQIVGKLLFNRHLGAKNGAPFAGEVTSSCCIANGARQYAFRQCPGKFRERIWIGIPSRELQRNWCEACENDTSLHAHRFCLFFLRKM
jgi:hypothetical protein